MDSRLFSYTVVLPPDGTRMLSDLQAVGWMIDSNLRYMQRDTERKEELQNQLNEMIVDLVLRLYVEQDKES